MKRQIVWFIVSCLMVAALILASCAPAVPEEKPTTPTTPTTPTPTRQMEKLTLTKLDGTVVEKLIEKPKYGGTITFIQHYELERGFDPWKYGAGSARHMGGWCFEDLGVGDRTRSPGGTGENKFNSAVAPTDYTRGCLAESWEYSPDGLNITFHLRKGIHWQNLPPVNGREFVASDVKFCVDRMNGLGEFAKAGPSRYSYAGQEPIIEVTTPDDYTVVFKCSRFDFPMLTKILTKYGSEIYPRECLDLPGGLDVWQNVIGTGAYIIKDYVTASSFTWVRNPDYWGYDELHPNNQLPYADEIKDLIILDDSTQQAAFRAGKADIYLYPGWDFRVAEPMKKSNPELQFGEYQLPTLPCLWMHQDIKPFNDVRVRKALQMSLDQKAVNEIMGGPGGGGTEPYWSWISMTKGPALWTPFEELPESVKEVVTYNPEKAKQLLAEAGYPNGFEFEAIVSATGGQKAYIKLSQIAADYWSRIGIKMNIQLVEDAVQKSYERTATYAQTCCGSAAGDGPECYLPSVFGAGKALRHNDQKGEELYVKAFSATDKDERNKAFKELNYYVTENVFAVLLGSRAPGVTAAQSWIRGWYGEGSLCRHQPGTLIMRLWVDQEMKQAMTGTR